jgi:septal ring factor EnvC (AmiA/AmiB activator)
MKLNHLFTYFSLLTASLLPSPAADTDAWLKNGLIHPEVIIKHHAELNLSADQQTKLMAMVEPAKTNVATLETALKKAQQELETILRNPDTTADEATDKLSNALMAEAALPPAPNTRTAHPSTCHGCQQRGIRTGSQNPG